MKIIDTDNFDSDYPNETVIADNIKNRKMAQIMCDALIDKLCSNTSPRFYRVENDDYVLLPGFSD